LEVEEEGLQDCSSNKWYQSEMILKADGDGGVMLLKLAEAVRSRCRAADSMRAGGRRREVELAGGVSR
jgi:hypothetical protein